MSRIALQLALDVGESARLVEIGERARPYIDWIEAGTPWILSEGMECVRTLHQRFPEKRIVADMKIADGGEYEARLGFQAGAGLITILSCASDTTLAGAVHAARLCGGKVMVDLINAPDLLAAARRAEKLGADYVCVHTAYDDQPLGKSPLDDLGYLAGQVGAGLVVAGGLNLDNLTQVAKYAPAAVVVGSALCRALDPAAYAERLRRLLDG
jgi:3-hexulose-6-phosphate synthase